ncbi:YjgB family protein [Shimazuella sp. AN120528]|uniref:DUF4309 domain-containing protein n=1 Tax=Shimazuella soli TaxID=1892854 RepID=UPI001F0D6234|nr:DUF4309 domain-containing protein [Shimazuella soli]MCH5585514.1 YjgB family protein [Shimazuella soli]
MKKFLWMKLVVAFAFIVVLTGCISSAQQNADASSKDVGHQKLIKQVLDLAAKGRTISSEEFGIGSQEADIVKKWGKPTSSNDTFLSYAAKKQTEFGLHKGIVTWVNSADKRLKEVTYEEVIKTAGTPASDEKKDGRRYVIYQSGKYKLSFLFDGYKTTEKILTVFVHPNK